MELYNHNVSQTWAWFNTALNADLMTQMSGRLDNDLRNELIMPRHDLEIVSCFVQDAKRLWEENDGHW